MVGPSPTSNISLTWVRSCFNQRPKFIGTAKLAQESKWPCLQCRFLDYYPLLADFIPHIAQPLFHCGGGFSEVAGGEGGMNTSTFRLNVG